MRQFRSETRVLVNKGGKWGKTPSGLRSGGVFVSTDAPKGILSLQLPLPQ